MYQTVLKRYELISPYPFFVAVKVFLITCPVLLVFVFSLVSLIQSQGFLVLHVCERASSLLSHPSGYPHSAHGTSTDHSHCLLWSAGPGLFLFRLVGLPLKWLPLKLLWLSGYTCLLAPTSAVVLQLGQSFSPPLLSGRTSKVHLRSVYTVLEFVVRLVTAGNAQEKGIFQLLFSNRETGAQETDLHWVKQEDGRWTQIWILPETPQPQKYPSVLLHLF